MPHESDNANSLDKASSIDQPTEQSEIEMLCLIIEADWAFRINCATAASEESSSSTIAPLDTAHRPNRRTA